MTNSTIRGLTIGFLASTALASPAFAQTPAETTPAQTTAADTTPPAQQAAQNEGEIVVTATKRAENLQSVPMAITAFATKTLEDNQVKQFDDYAKMIPSLSYKSAGPGFANVYFRGVASGENANHSTSLPSVGTYLDEQPITTIHGALDLNIYDIARIEALAGPQGTLYGASSEAGTVRIITNKPDLSGTYGRIDLEGNKIAHGDFGYVAQGFINAPLSSNIAARVVGWYRRDGGYIDNIQGSRTYPSSGITITNHESGSPIYDLAENNYNDVYTYGARAALKIDLDDNWTITPTVMGQKQTAYGSFAEESGLDPLQTMQFWYEASKDKWWQAALTVEGKISDFDVTYAGAYMRRRVDTSSDYSDYSYVYDVISSFGTFWVDNNGDMIDPTQYIIGIDRFRKLSQELRFASPADKPIRAIAGLFYQRQQHHILQNYIINNITDDYVVPTTDSDIWLTDQMRVDRDYAAFGELSYDIIPQLTLTGGGRWYKYKNSLTGFFGFNNPGYSGNPNYDCSLFPPPTVGGPCNNVDKTTSDTGFVYRFNATWKPRSDLLFYATWSKGFRPGGVNRRGTLPPYKPDFLVNYEAGAKITFSRGAHLNMAIYQENWDQVQLSFLGENGLTEVRNAGNARIRGIEADLLLKPVQGLTWSTGVSYNDAKMRTAFCSIAVPNFDCSINVDLDNSGVIGDDPLEINQELAPKGTRLPLTAKFKMNSRLRYEWNVSGMLAHLQGAVTYEGKRRRDLRTFENSIYGDMKAYTLVDGSAGIERGPWEAELYVKNLFDKRGQLSKSIQCLESVCGDPDHLVPIGPKIYTVVTQPRTIGIRLGYRFD